MDSGLPRESYEDEGVSLNDLEAIKASLVIQTDAALPILALENDIGKLLNTHRVLLVLGETGSGKTTQLPQILLRLGWANNGFRVAVIQPNPLTAYRLSSRLDAELGGYGLVECVASGNQGFDVIRTDVPIVVFDQKSFLKRAISADPQLSAFSIVFLDEVHERTVCMDLICGLMKRVLSNRDDLRLLLASATMDTRSIGRFFKDCASIVSEGRNFPIQISYLRRPTWDFIDRCVNLIVELHHNEPNEAGDILVFMPSRETCDELVRRLSHDVPSRQVINNLISVPLHEGMSIREQQIAIMARQNGKRKAVIATEIAETSVTIPNIAFIVDSMWAQQAIFDGNSGLVTLETRAISKSRANQRAGRAGRIAPGGKCIRLCTEADFQRLLPRHETAQIMRSDLVDVVLFLKSIGIDDVVDFPFMAIPPSEAFIRAFDILYALNALDEEARLTEEGKQLVKLPVDAPLGKILLKAFDFPHLVSKVVDLVSIIASGVASPVLASSSTSTLATFSAREGDHLTLCNLAQGALEANKYWKVMSFERLDAFRAYRNSLRHTLTKARGEAIDWNPPWTKQPNDGESILRCVVSGCFPNAAKLQSNGLYRTARDGRQVRVHSSSVVSRFGKPPQWICFHEAVLTSSTQQRFDEVSSGSVDDRPAVVRIVSAIDPRWLLETAPHFYRRVSTS